MPTNNSDYQKRWREKNREKCLQYQEQRTLKRQTDGAFRQKDLEAHKRFRERNREKRGEQSKLYYYSNKNNPEWSNHYREYHRVWNRDKRASEPQFKLAENLRNRVNAAIRRARSGNWVEKPASAVKQLGCTINELKGHLESKFLLGMSWDNYGGGDYSKEHWHVDHIRPLASFDLSNKEEFLRACHYSNLQPLWAIDNLSKSDNYAESAL